MGLQLRMRGVAVLLMMKVAEQEERKPSSWIEACTMDKHEERCKFPAIFPWDHVHHPSRVLDGVIPECPGHLLFGEICPGHVDNDFPVGFH